MADLEALLADLRDEGDELAELVGPLDERAWATKTPAPGWTIAHQIAHLAWTDRMALLAVRDPSGFNDTLRDAAGAIDSYVDDAAEQGAGQPPAELFAAWQQGRTELREALRSVAGGGVTGGGVAGGGVAGGGVAGGGKIAWFGPPMSPASMATARLMETWAHGGDVADALGIRRVPTARIRHVAYLSIRTRDFAFRMHGKTPPAEAFRIELSGPDGELWAWGETTAGQRVTGPAVDFCLLATQRTHRADTALVADGAEAELWLDIIQAFAGPAGPGRAAHAQQST